MVMMVAGLALGSGCRDRPAPRPEPEGLALADCTVAGYGHPVECGGLEVPEDRSGKGGDGKTIALRVVRVPVRGSEPEPVPLFMLAGGPGQAATEAYPPILAVLGDATRNREVVLVDQRGTGQSAPLDCEVPEGLAYAFDEDGLREVAKSCAEGLERDLARYTTAASADDLDAVRAAFGYEKIDVLGASYGTRLALAYAERHPERVRSLVLDGMAPRALKIPLPLAEDASRAVHLMNERCKKDASCHEAFGDLEVALDAVLSELDEAPVLTVRHPRLGHPVELRLTRDGFTQALRGLLYAPELVALLPLAISEAREGHFDPFVTQAYYLGDEQRDAISLGLFLSIVCSEDVPRISDAEVAAQTKGTFIGDAMVRYFRRACAEWPAGPTPAGLDEPVAVAAPVLALSGELDPVTPPRWAEHVIEHVEGPHKHVVVPGAGHGTMIRGCVPELIGRFLDAPNDVASLDEGCLVDVAAEFFVSFAGPPH
jgi:pimeloyl-ACP methyl ester carboxylesterase